MPPAKARQRRGVCEEMYALEKMLQVFVLPYATWVPMQRWREEVGVLVFGPARRASCTRSITGPGLCLSIQKCFFIPF